MRAIVLLLLAGSLLWLVVWNLGSSQASEAKGAGYFLPDSPPEPAVTPPENGGGEPTVHAATAQADRAEPAAAARDPLPEASTPAPIPPELGTIGEIALACELLHRPHTIEVQLSIHEASLPAQRRRLILALASAIRGDIDAARRLGHGLADDSAAGSPAERALLERVVDARKDRPVVATLSRESPLMLAATMGMLASEGEAALERREYRDAAGTFSELLLGELRAPWKAETAVLRTWTDALSRAQASYQWNRKGGWPSIEVTVEKGDSLISIRKRVLQDHPDLLLCTGLIERVNQISGGSIQPGQVLRIPSERAHVLVDVDAHWTLYFLGDLVAAAWEVGVGKVGSETPPGTFRVGDKNTEPMWFPPGKQPVPFGDEQNPLGTRWIGWVGDDGRNSRLAFHGTKNPDSIGQDMSEGCVRMLNRDVEELYDILPRGALVTVQP